ncbi:MAG: hypothetical protein V7679_13990, partial [Parasphingorhabdus sp.]
RSIEAAAAADILHELLDASTFSNHVQPLIGQGMPWVLRNQLSTLHGFEQSDVPSVLQILQVLCKSKQFGDASLETLLVLAEQVKLSEPDGSASRELVGATPVWILDKDIGDIAARYSDLALVLLRTQDGRRYAA